jgi:hypothetical protein
MSFLKIIETPEEEYKLFKQDLYDENPKMVVLPQNYTNDVYVEKKIDMPIVLKMFIGSISLVGLALVYKMIQSSKRM